MSRLGNTFFGQNFELYIGKDFDGIGTLCGYGPTSDTKQLYSISCFGGSMTGRTLTIKNKFTGGLKLCDVQIFGEEALYSSGVRMEGD